MNITSPIFNSTLDGNSNIFHTLSILYNTNLQHFTSMLCMQVKSPFHQTSCFAYVVVLEACVVNLHTICTLDLLVLCSIDSNKSCICTLIVVKGTKI